MSRKKGDVAEAQAITYLQEALGFQIIETNFYSRFGEVDIIALHQGVVHFIEVKSAQEYEIAINNITRTKISKLTKTIDVYIKKKKITSDYTLDAIIVTPQGCDFIENITL